MDSLNQLELKVFRKKTQPMNCKVSYIFLFKVNFYFENFVSAFIF